MIQEAQAVAETVAAHGNEFSSQLATGALLAYALQWVKRSRFVPWVSDHTKGINRALTGLTSFIATIGIHYTFDPTAGVLVIGGLHTQTLLEGGWAWIEQWAFQAVAGDVIIAKTTAEAVSVGDVPKPTGKVDA